MTQIIGTNSELTVSDEILDLYMESFIFNTNIYNLKLLDTHTNSTTNLKTRNNK